MEADAKRLAALEEELRKDLEAITRVRQIMSLKNGSLRLDDRQLKLPIAGKPAKDDAIDSAEEDADDAPITSLRGKIAEVINSDPTVRWTTQRVLAHLQQSGFPLRAEKPIFSVGQSLSALVRKGKIRMVRKGTGSQPNIYKGLNSARNQDAQTEADSQGENIIVGPTTEG